MERRRDGVENKVDVRMDEIINGDSGLTEESPVETIAVLRLGTLGDMILTTPLFSALKQQYPDSHLTVIANEWNSLIPKHHAGVDEVIAIPSGVKGVTDWIRTLRFQRFDLYIDPKDHSSTTSRIVAELIRAKTKLVVPENLPMLSSADIIPPPSGLRFTDSALAPMIILAPDTEFSSRPSLQVPEPEFDLSRIAKEPFILVNISTGGPTRRWPESKWTEFVKSVDWHGKIVILSSPGDAESGTRIASVREEAFYQPTKSLMEAAALVARTACVITSDTSIVHIAGALNKPIVALYFNAPKMMAKFAPLSDLQRVITAPKELAVDVINIEEVLRACTELFILL
ncbi:MAG: glycosyltransferase family 9 protein [Chlorobi bacterium]|nr:glycosyltransferase family 9 protein [Chlorobiota bacterium]